MGSGLRGVAITGLPGTQPYSVVYMASGEQLYELGLWTQTPGLDARAHVLLGSLRFTPPTRSRAATMADVEAGLITEGPHTIDAAPEAVAIASAPSEFTHPRKQGPPRCGLTQRICRTFQGIRGVPTEIAYPAEPGGSAFS